MTYFSDVNWAYQTFTAGKNYSLTSVVLPLKKSGNPGEITVEIRSTDYSGGHPSGSVLCLGTTDGDSLPSESYESREITFSSPVPLVGGEVYAIVIRASDEYGIIARKGTDASYDYYTGGTAGRYDGSTWYKYDDYTDSPFETYGDDIIAGSTKYEYLDGTPNSNAEITTAWYRGQTFTPNVTFYASGVKLCLQRSGTSAALGNVFGYLTAVDGSGLPTGDVLATSIVPSRGITTDSGVLYEFNFNSPVKLTGGTKYAFWVKRDITDGTILIWGEDVGGSTYEGGNWINYIGSWSNDTDLDLIFQVWGFGPPHITDQSSDTSVYEWSEVSFFVAAEGEEPFTYQWYKNAAEIEGETNATLDLSDVVMSDAGTYTCVVTNDYDSDESDPIILKVMVLGEAGGADIDTIRRRNIFNMPLDLDAEDT